MTLCFKGIKWKKLRSKFLLAGDKFTHEMNYGILNLHIALAVHLLKIKKIQRFKGAGDLRCIYMNQKKVCIQHDIPYGDFKDLPRRTAPDELFCDRVFNITINTKYDGHQKWFASMVSFNQILRTNNQLKNCTKLLQNLINV